MSSLQEVLNRANTDEQFRARLKANPAAVCQEAGVEIPAEATFEVIERNRNDLHLLLGSRTNVPKIDQLLERADKDAAFRKQLVSNSKAAIESATGEMLPATCKIHVREANPNVMYLFLDEQCADGELSESELAGVAGGNPFVIGMIVGAVAVPALTTAVVEGAGADVFKLGKQYADQKKGQRPK